jgi:hypothetical protein
VDLLKGLAPEVRTVEIRRESPSDRPADPAASSHAPRDQMEVPVDPVRQNAEPDHDPAAAVVASIRTAGRPLSRSEILEATGLPEQQWTAVINALRAGGHVVSHGRKRGVTWGLPGVQADRDARE